MDELQSLRFYVRKVEKIKKSSNFLSLLIWVEKLTIRVEDLASEVGRAVVAG